MNEIVTAETVERAARELLKVRAQQRGLTGDQWDKVGPPVQFEMKEQAHAVLRAAAPAVAERALSEVFDRLFQKDAPVPSVAEVQEDMERTMFSYHQEIQP